MVLETANCDHLGNAKAIAEGLKRKLEKTGTKGKYIHTSGSGIVMEDAAGEYESKIIYDDTNSAQMNGIPSF